jgi:hypothetical protein
MLDDFIDRLGDWNPQLFRELTGRLTSNNLIVVVAMSILAQLLLVAVHQTSHASFDRQVRDIFNLLNWAIPATLTVGSAYMITADLNRENSQGTFEFIQWSPQSARSIFLGKILGVPSLIYLAILLAAPLHFATGLLSDISLPQMLTWYATIATIAYFCSSMVILLLLHSPKPAILITLLFAVPVSIIIERCNYCASLLTMSNSSRFLSWFYLPIDRNIYVFDAFVISTLLAICYWQWLTIERRYVNPNNTFLSKGNSYCLNIQLQIWLLGFVVPICVKYPAEVLRERFYLLIIFYIVNAVFVWCLIPLILPHRSSVEDWYHNRKHSDLQHRHWLQQDLVRDFCWDDRTPIGLAMLINLSIPATGWYLYFEIFCAVYNSS